MTGVLESPRICSWGSFVKFSGILRATWHLGKVKLATVGVLTWQKLANMKIRIFFSQRVVKYLPAPYWSHTGLVTPQGALQLKWHFRIVLLWAKWAEPLYPHLYWSLNEGCLGKGMRLPMAALCSWDCPWRTTAIFSTIWNKSPSLKWTLSAVSPCVLQPLPSRGSNIIDLGWARTLWYFLIFSGKFFYAATLGTVQEGQDSCWDDSVFCLCLFSVR